MTSQLQLINKILQNKDFSIISLNNLTDKYFFDYKNEFNFIVNHYNQFKTVPDKLTFLNTFPDFDITEVNEPTSYLLEQLYKDYHAAYLATRFNNMKKMLESGETDKALDYFKESAENIHTGSVVQSHSYLDDTSRYDEYLERAQDMSKFYLNSGFKELDKLIYGIDRKNEFMVISARPGRMKSWVLLKMAAAAAEQGLCVGVYSGEMEKNKVFYRLDTLIGNIRNSSIMHSDLFIDKEYKAFVHGGDRNLVKGDIHVMTPADIDGPVTVSALQAFVERDKLDILLIDQISLLDDNSGARQTFEKVANISKAIKNLQVKKQIPIIAVSQMNRTKLGGEDDTDDSNQDLTQLALSDRLGQDATCVIMLSKKDDDKLVLNLVKLRDGPSGKKLTYHVDINNGIFDYINEDKNESADYHDDERLSENDIGSDGKVIF